MIVNPVTESINPGEILRERNTGVFLVKIENDFVDGRGNFLKKWVVNEPDETIERKLKN